MTARRQEGERRDSKSASASVKAWPQGGKPAEGTAKAARCCSPRASMRGRRRRTRGRKDTAERGLDRQNKTNVEPVADRRGVWTPCRSRTGTASSAGVAYARTDAAVRCPPTSGKEGRRRTKGGEGKKRVRSFHWTALSSSSGLACPTPQQRRCQRRPHQCPARRRRPARAFLRAPHQGRQRGGGRASRPRQPQPQPLRRRRAAASALRWHACARAASLCWWRCVAGGEREGERSVRWQSVRRW